MMLKSITHNCSLGTFFIVKKRVIKFCLILGQDGLHFAEHVAGRLRKTVERRILAMVFLLGRRGRSGRTDGSTSNVFKIQMNFCWVACV